jgi:hypothetical protein
LVYTETMTTTRTAATLKLQQIAQDRHHAIEAKRIARLENEYRIEMAKAAKIAAPKLTVVR